MPFDNLPRQPQMSAVAEAYAAETLARSRAVAAASRVLLDVPYGDDYWQRLDLYLPADDRLRVSPRRRRLRVSPIGGAPGRRTSAGRARRGGCATAG
jgi:hypothetical protein